MNINDAIPTWILKHGMSGVLVAWLFLTNNRLAEVEQRLYNCYEKQVIMRVGSTRENGKSEANKLVAILPNELRIKISRNEPDTEV